MQSAARRIYRGNVAEGFEAAVTLDNALVETSTFSTCAPGANLLVRGYIVPIEIKRWGYSAQLSLEGPKAVPISVLVYLDTHTSPLVDIPLDKPPQQREYVLFMTSHSPHAPQGIILAGNPDAMEDGNTVGSFQRVGMATAKKLLKERDWSDDSSEEEEMEIVPVAMWKWDAWEAIAKLQRFRIY